MKLTRIMTALLFAMTTAAPALAQPVGDASGRRHWLGMLLAIVLALCVAVASMRSSKRSPLD